ncbi:uncharacterized protein SAPINGB_P001793 [Magnusiomyces paraingens]|uniref:Uncharacterized protein n=1 Tax=Magnusiomyces paraingens TaxID=2606893 RepID=A0A5E8BBH9_9ASCO|nr:uncharacterized protein SAPINGB_P001793 [Saprochaete ingens]VVT48466.1 unnamed protein product [Saprochaete ingens]
MGLYGLDDQTRRLIRLENFKDNFSVKEFIEVVAVNYDGFTSSKNTEALDPKPYIRTFEAVLHELERLQNDISNHESAAAIEVKNAEIKHCQNVIATSQEITGVLRDFGALDDTVGDISTATSQLNGRLEKLSLQYEKSVESSFLINSYLNINKHSSCEGLERLWESNHPADKRKCANVVRQIQILSRKLEDVENGEKSRDIIDKFAEKLERDLLNDFDTAYRSADLVIMKESADILTDFNGGSSVVQMFVNQHDYFIVQENLVDESLVMNDEVWTKICDPEGDYSEFEDTLTKMATGMEDVIMQELQIIRKVFRDPVVILKVFLQRVFAQKIQLQIEAYLKKAESLSSLAYVRTLHVAYTKIKLFTTSLKSAFSKQNIDTNDELSALLDQNFLDNFVPYIENGQYFDAELRSLNEVTMQSMAKFTEAHNHKLSREQSLLSRFTSSGDKQAGPLPAGTAGAAVSDTTLERHGSFSSLNNNSKEKETGRIGQLIRAVRLERTNSDRKPGENHFGMHSSGSSSNLNQYTEYDETDGDIKPEMVRRILSSMAESVKRDLEMSEASRIPGHAKLFVNHLLNSLCKNCIDIVLEEAYQLSLNQEIKSQVDLSYLKLISDASNAIMLMSSMIKTVIYPMVSTSSPPMRTVITTLVNTYYQRSETKINKTISNTVETCISRLSYLLSRQKKKDFLPREDSIEIVQQSVTCTEVIVFLTMIHKSALTALDGDNLTMLLEDIGFGFRDLVLDHFKKFSVNRTGARIAAKDIDQYHEAMERWSVPAVSSAFMVADAIAELFTVSPQNVSQLIRNTPNLSQAKFYNLREYLAKRADFTSDGIVDQLSALELAGSGRSQ